MGRDIYLGDVQQLLEKENAHQHGAVAKNRVARIFKQIRIFIQFFANCLTVQSEF